MGEGDRKRGDRGFSNGSLLGSGNVGGGAFIVGSGGGGVRWKAESEMWQREVASGLARMRQEKQVLIFADSKTAIAAVRKTGRAGRARSRHLQNVVNTVVLYLQPVLNPKSYVDTVAEIKGGGGRSNWDG